MPEPFQSSPSFVPVIEKGFESDILSTSFKGRMQGGLSGRSPLRSVSNERDKTANSSSLARIRVVVGSVSLPVMVCSLFTGKPFASIVVFSVSRYIVYGSSRFLTLSQKLAVTLNL